MRSKIIERRKKQSGFTEEEPWIEVNNNTV